MDRPRVNPGNPAVRRIRRLAFTGIGLLALVTGVAALPPAFLYLSSRLSGTPLPSANDRAVFGGDAFTSTARAVMARKPGVVAFVDVHVVPMDREGVIPHQTVIVRDGVIAEVGPAARVKVPRGAQRIDGRNKYLMPGLADMHAHLRFGEAQNVAMLQLFVANGVTTILNLYGTSQHLELRSRIAEGEVLGPTLYTSGPFISDAPRSMPTPEEAEREVAQQKRAGYDVIKIHGDFSREAYQRLFAAARREKIRVVGHSPRNLGWEVMAEERQDVVAHAEEYIYDRQGSSRHFGEVQTRIPQIAAATAKAGTWLIPNLTAYKGIAEQANNIEMVLSRPEVKYAPPDILDEWMPAKNRYVKRFGPETYPGFLARYQVLEELTKGFQDAGVQLLTGTDTAIPCVVPGFSIHDELRYMVDAGLTPYQALRAATANPGEFLGEKRFGTVAAGSRADLLLVNANPLENVGNAAKRTGVMVRGRWLEEAEIQRLLAELLSSYGTR